VNVMRFLVTRDSQLRRGRKRKYIKLSPRIIFEITNLEFILCLANRARSKHIHIIDQKKY
jgi:hypothetical protein